MKNKLILAAACALPLISQAQDGSGQESGPYVNFGLGLSIVEDLDGFADNPIDPRLDYQIEFDPGVRLDVAPGFSLNRFVAFELNTGFIYNTFDKVDSNFGTAHLEGDLFQVPILANVILKYPTELITPFIGGGGGGVYERLSIDETEESGDDFFGAFQLFGGVQYRVGENLAVGLVYKYLHVYSEDEESLPTGESAGLGDVTTHSIGAIITLDF